METVQWIVLGGKLSQIGAFQNRERGAFLLSLILAKTNYVSTQQNAIHFILTHAITLFLST